jgi:uncharacterized protein (TIGR02246 family)
MIGIARIARYTVLTIVLGSAGVAAAQKLPVPPRPAAAPRPTPAKKIEAEASALTSALVKAFNAHDARAVAAQWAPDGVHTATLSGEKIEGRQAIAVAYGKLFEADPKLELALRVNSVRRVADDVLSAECSSVVRRGSGEISRSNLIAVLVRRDGRWTIDQVRETDVVADKDPSQPLADLNWLAGKWSDDAVDFHVTNDFQWVNGGRFLSRRFEQTAQGQVVRSGTQLFGWDPVQGKIRCWIFSSDGSFGEGACTRDGENQWKIKLVVTLADGRSGSFTQLIERLSEEKFSVRTVDRDLNGEFQPNGEAVELQREPSAARAPELEGMGGGGGFF